MVKKILLFFLLIISTSYTSEVDYTKNLSPDTVKQINLLVASKLNTMEIHQAIINLLNLSRVNKKFYSLINNIGFFQILINNWFERNKSIFYLLEALLIWPDKKTIVEALRSIPNAKEVFETAYNIFIIARCKEKVEIFLRYGANPDIKLSNFENKPAIVYAASYGDLDLVKLLIKYKADINSTDENGYTAIMVAAKNNFYKTVNLLLQHNADIYIQAKDKKTFKNIVGNKMTAYKNLSVYRSNNKLYLMS